MHRCKTARGFGLMEIVISVTILALLGVIVVIGLNGYRRERQVDAATEAIVFELLETRNKTSLAENGQQYGIRLNATSVERFIGSVYSSGPSNELIDFDDGVEIGSVTLELGGKDVSFGRVTGETADYGTFEVSSVADASSTRLVTITPFGLVNVD